MKKFGFTLPEILVALTIVGIIAATTIPQVVSNVEARKTGALLGRAAEQISLACQNAIQEYNDSVIDARYAEKLSDINSQDLNLQEHLGLTEAFVSSADAAKYGDTSGWYILSKSPVYIKNDGNTFYVDVNGFFGKNDLGVDQFKIHLNDNCTITPVDSATTEIFQNNFRVKVD